MDDLQRHYRAALVRRVEALESAREALLAGESDAADTIRQIAHTLKGSGGTYGYPGITAAAEVLQEAPPDQTLAHLDRLLAVLRRVISGG